MLRVGLDGAVTQVLGATGDGTHGLDFPAAVAVETQGGVLVAGLKSDNVFRVAADGTVRQILSASGDGTHALDEPAAAPSRVSAPRPSGVALDASQRFYVAGQSSDNAIAGTLWQPTALRELVASAGDGRHRLRSPTAVVVDAQRTVYSLG